MFSRYASAFVVFPGGFGTLDELFEALTLIQTGKIRHFPVVLAGSRHWSGLEQWIRTRLLELGMVSAGDVELLLTAQVPTAPVQVYLTPDAATVLSADQSTREVPGRTVSMIDTAAMAVRSTVTTGSGPHGVVIDTAGTRAWVTNTYDNTVSVIDLPTASVVATVPTGTAPSGISYSTRTPAAGGSANTTLEIPPPVAGTATQTPHSHEH